MDKIRILQSYNRQYTAGEVIKDLLIVKKLLAQPKQKILNLY